MSALRPRLFLVWFAVRLPSGLFYSGPSSSRGTPEFACSLWLRRPDADRLARSLGGSVVPASRWRAGF